MGSTNELEDSIISQHCRIYRFFYVLYNVEIGDKILNREITKRAIGLGAHAAQYIGKSEA